jgi:excisionase family DNA binding protein
MTTGEAARLLERSNARVRQLAESGDLPYVRTVGGLHLFEEPDVLAVKKLLEEKRRERSRGRRSTTGPISA